MAAAYTLWRWIGKRSWLRSIVAGLVLGLAGWAKLTTIVLFFLWPALWLVERLVARVKPAPNGWLGQAGMLVLALSVAVYVINVGYGFAGTGHAWATFIS